MSTKRLDDAEYPYLPKSEAARTLKNAMLPILSPSAWRWMKRFGIATGALAVIVLIVGGVALKRGASQAWMIRDLEQRGCYVTYWNEPQWLRDSLPYSVREKEHWWGEVRDVRVSSPLDEDIQAACDACSSFAQLRSFEIVANSFSCERISRWPHLDRLEKIDVESARLSDADLAIIGRMTGLTKLRIARARISNEGVRHLAQLPLLERLTFDKVQFNVSGVAAIQGFGALKSFVVGQSSEFGDDAIVSFGPLPQLEELNFNRTPIGDRGLAHLMGSGEAREFRELIVNEGKITDAGMALLADYPAPRWLVLSGMPLTDAGVAALAGKQFPVMILDHTVITDEAFRALNDIRGLEYLSFANSKVTGSGVSYLNLGQPLRHLDVGGPAITSAGLQALAAAPCKELGLSGSDFGDAELMLFVNNDDLVQLTIPDTRVTDRGLAAFFATRRQRLKGAGRDDPLEITRDPYLNVVDSASSMLDSSAYSQIDTQAEPAGP